MVFGDVEDDRARLEQGKIAFLIGRNQAGGMKAHVRGFLLRLQRDEAHLVRLAHLFQRPANAGVARQAPAAIGRPLNGGDDDRHRSTHLRWGSYASDLAHIENSSLAADVSMANAKRGSTETAAVTLDARAALRSSWSSPSVE